MKKSLYIHFINLLLIFCFFWIFLSIYLERYFGEVSFTQLIYHLRISTWALIDADEYIVKKCWQSEVRLR